MKRVRRPANERRRLGAARHALPAALAALLALAACAGRPAFRGEPLEGAAPVRIAGVNWDGEAFDLAGLDHRVAVVFFGYTLCPDVCPMTLAKMKRLFGELGGEVAKLEEEPGEEPAQVAVVFVSVDPRRDTREKLAQYVPAFDGGFYGVHVAGPELEAAKRSFGVSARSRAAGARAGGEPGSYFIDHTGSIFLLDRLGRPRVAHPAEARLEDLAADVAALLAEARG